MTQQAPSPGLARAWLACMPGVFVVIWSTGFIVARYGMPHAPPLGFLSWRYALSLIGLSTWVVISGARWPQGRSQWLHLGVTGLLMHAGYLGGVWAAVKAGIGAGTVALIVGLQPMLTAIWMSRQAGQAQPASGSSASSDPSPAGQPSATRAHVSLSRLQWTGLLLGLLGLALVVERKLTHGEITPLNLGLAVLALLSITAGTLYQKRHVLPCDVRSANAVQLMAALAVTLPLAGFERGGFDWQPELLGALAWSVLVLTMGGSSLLYLLLQRGAATQVASLMYLVPPCTALMAAALFGEALTPSVLIGIGLAVAGVALVVRRRGG
ncbi:MAG: DMT family transporter [Leptothrix sp. (in: b-proteobacteria)]